MARKVTFTIDLERMRAGAQKAAEGLAELFSPLSVPEFPGDPAEWGDGPLPSLVGVGGLKGHGKDAFVDFLVADSGYAKTFMSEPLTAALSLIGPRGPWVRLDHDIRVSGSRIAEAGDFIRYAELVELVGYTAAKEHRDAREYLQGLGTEVGRNMLGEDVWVDIAKKKISEARAAGTPVAITGIRYQNEIDLVRSLGGVTVWIERTAWPVKASHPLTDAIDEALKPEPDPTATHSSETSLSMDDFDVVIENDSTLDALRRQASRFAAEIAED